METEVNIYKTAYCLDAYSKDGSYEDPIFKFPPHYFRGDTGQAKDIQVFLKNDGDTTLDSVPDQQAKVYPVDISGVDESTWVKLATSQAGLDIAIGGAGLNLPKLLSQEVFPFWIRVTVPAGTPEENKKDIRIAVLTFAHPLYGYMNALFSYSYDVAARAANFSYSYDVEGV